MSGVPAGLLQDIYILYRGLGDPEVPWYVKALVVLTVAYIISPIDLIPDFIPVLGLLDEAIVIPLAVRLAVRLMPPELWRKYQGMAEQVSFNRSLALIGTLLVLCCWLALIIGAWLLLG